jgi:hypothetical protein
MSKINIFTFGANNFCKLTDFRKLFNQFCKLTIQKKKLLAWTKDFYQTIFDCMEIRIERKEMEYIDLITDNTNKITDDWILEITIDPKILRV